MHDVYEIKGKDWLDTSVFRISLVKEPAIETDFIFLSKEDYITLAVEKEKRMIYSPVLIPEKRIFQRTKDKGEHYIFFSAETISNMSRDYMLKKTTLGDWNAEHDESLKLSGVDVIENWIVEDPETDKSKGLGFNVPAGTWMQGTYISNDNVWNDIKLGKYKGVSIEADVEKQKINLNKLEMSDEKDNTSKVLSELAKDVKSLLGISKKEDKVKLASVSVGEITYYTPADFVQGAPVFMDEAMSIPFESGVIEVDGKTITVEAGIVASVMDAMASEQAAQLSQLSEVARTQVTLSAQIKEEILELRKEKEELKEELKNVKIELAENIKLSKENDEALKKAKDIKRESITRLSAQSVGGNSKYQELINKSNLNK